jgi:hypothetical protein
MIMNHQLRALAGMALLLALPLAAAAEPQCSHETLDVQGTPITISYCLANQGRSDGGEQSMPVQAVYSTTATSFSQTSTMRFVTSAGPARLLQSVNLAPLGLTGTLHLTLVYAGGFVRIESALLTPGAVRIK